jgi:hypothetical protein
MWPDRRLLELFEIEHGSGPVFVLASSIERLDFD